VTRWSERMEKCTYVVRFLFIYNVVRCTYLLSSWYPKVMSSTPPPPFSVAGLSLESSSGDEESPSPSPSPSATATTTAALNATATLVDNAVHALLMQTFTSRPKAKPKVTQTSDYGEPSKPSSLRSKSSRLSKRFKKLLVSAHLKKGKSKLVLPRISLVHLSDDESKASSSIVEARGRSLTSRPPRSMRPLPLYELHDDGQGSWVDEFGYIYRAGLDTSTPNLNLGCDGDAGTAASPSVEHGCHPCRVDSRVPGGSLGVGGDGPGGKDSRGSEAPGCAPFESTETHGQRFPEGEVAESISASRDMSGDDSSCRGPKNERVEDDDVSTEILDAVLAAGYSAMTDTMGHEGL
jgi:hypothetical protein